MERTWAAKRAMVGSVRSAPLGIEASTGVREHTDGQAVKPLRVLVASLHPVPYCETYIRSEIDWLELQDVEFSWWAQCPATQRGYPSPEHALVGGLVSAAVERFKPDLVHVFKLNTAADVLAEGINKKLPVTVRGHSIDFSVPRVRLLKAASRVWLFPHHAAWVCDQQNVEVLPVAYDPQRHYPLTASATSSPYVVRAAYGAPWGKGLDEFVEIARLCPDTVFKLAVVPVGLPEHDRMLSELLNTAPRNVVVSFNLTNEDAAALVRKAKVCLRGHDPNSHAYGMPISIAEAMGAGLPIIARAGDEDTAAQLGPESFIGDAGFFYKTIEEGANLVREIMAWSPELYESHRQRRVLPRARLYRNDVVLPRVLDVWRSLT